jgi:CheY-like chemotaxis protein
LNVMLVDFGAMLGRLLGERITISVKCDPALWRVKADPGEISRVLMNLSLNARDAMPDGGNLSLETANLTLTETAAANQKLPAGNYVMLAVRDNGVGIEADLRAHIFEPFFTTKESGKGTGLGLATVLGVVQQSGGTIQCESQVGTGTVFKILLPAVEDPGTNGSGGIDQEVKGGSEVILVVEDEALVRGLTKDVLEGHGYKIHEAHSGREGLAFCEVHEGPIDLLVSDVVMPGLGGREFVESALKLRPGLKVLFVSGHARDVLLKEGIQNGTPFLQKPFTPAALAQIVRDTLDSKGRLAPL